MPDEKRTVISAKQIIVAIGAFALLGLIGVRFAEPPDPREDRPPKPAAEKKKDHAKRGDIVTPNPAYLNVCMDTPEGMKEAAKWYKDHAELWRVIARYGGTTVGPNDRMKVLDPVVGWTMARVRLMPAEREERECYCLIELVKH